MSRAVSTASVTDRTAIAEQMRVFNRFYTETIGALDEAHEGLEVNLAQSRMLFTTRHLGTPEVGEVAAALRLDLAYTSRVLGTLEDRGLVRRDISPIDRRRRVVTLTDEGAEMLGQIEQRSNQRMLDAVAHLGPDDLSQLLDAMDTIRQLLRPEGTP